VVAAHEDAVDSLLGQHQQITNLFAQVDKSVGEHRQALFAELIALIAVHESVEQALIHPLAEKAVDAAIVHDRIAEEQSAEDAFARLYDLDFGSPEFAEGLAGVRDAVIAHALAEEEQEFLRLRESGDSERLAQLVAVVAATPALAAALPAAPPAEVFEQARAAVQGALPTERDTDGES
jgi:hypothetical protein